MNICVAEFVRCFFSQKQKALIFIAIPSAAAIIGHFLFLGLYWISGFALREDDRAGKWIGFLERALVSIFVLAGHIEATVFIFAAKAAVLGIRIGEGSAKKKREIAEYMLIGTMMSYLIAIFFGLLGRAFN